MNNGPNDRTSASESTNDASVLKQCYHIHTLPPQNQTRRIYGYATFSLFSFKNEKKVYKKDA